MEVAAYRQPSVLGRKRAFGTCKAKTEVSIFGAVDDTEIVRQRSRSELVAARGLLEKALAALSSPSSPVSPSAPRVVKHSRRRGFLAAEPRSQEPPAKKIKASPSAPVIKRKKMTRGERDLLAAGLAELASELPDHIIKLLKKHSRGISAGEMEIDINSVQDEALREIQQLFDPFVSPLLIAPEPLQLPEEEDEYVDICGDTSPAVNPKNLGDDATISGSSDSESPAERDATLLIAHAKDYLERSKAREKARQEVLETERTAMPTETIHPAVLYSLGIVDRYNVMARSDSLLRQLGLFLKVDDYDIEEQQHRQRQSFQEDLEEGEILG